MIFIMIFKLKYIFLEKKKYFNKYNKLLIHKNPYIFRWLHHMTFYNQKTHKLWDILRHILTLAHSHKVFHDDFIYLCNIFHKK